MPAAGDLGNIPIGRPDGAPGLFGALAPTVQGTAINAGEAKPAHPLAVGEGMSPVPARLVKLIQSGQFVDFEELLPDNLELLRRLQASAVTDTNEAGHRHLRQVPSLGMWVQCFAIYAAIVLWATPSHALNLMAYLQLVVHEAQYHSGMGWLLYDTCFRQLAAHLPGAHSPAIIWSQLHASLYAATILAMDQSPASHCLHCLEPEYSTAACALCPHQKPGDTTEANCNTSAKLNASLLDRTRAAPTRPLNSRYAVGTTLVPVTGRVVPTDMSVCDAAAQVTDATPVLTHLIMHQERRRFIFILTNPVTSEEAARWTSK